MLKRFFYYKKFWIFIYNSTKKFISHKWPIQIVTKGHYNNGAFNFDIRMLSVKNRVSLSRFTCDTQYI